MKFNLTKCEYLRISSKHNTLYVIKQAKYLGVTIDQKLNCNEHINNIVKKGDSVHGFLQRNLRNFPIAMKV